MGKALLRVTVLCTLCTLTVHAALVNIITVHTTTELIVVVGKTNALHLVDCTSMDVDCSKDEEAEKKGKARFKHLQLLLIFLCTLEFTSSTADWQQKKRPSTNN